MDLEYYRRRLTDAVAAAKSAVEPCGRIAHQKMARAYAVVIRNAALPSAKARRPVHEDVIGQWETDGGAIQKMRRRREGSG